MIKEEQKSIKIDEFTICLHCGSSIEVVNNQMRLSEPLKEKYKIHWNNRIDRHPGAYQSYSALVNDAVVTSPTEWIILLNDRVIPTLDDIDSIISNLENGFACSTRWSVAFMGFSKELFRKIGFFDERFYGGGYEDDDFVLRLKLANLSYYESEEAEYEQNWKSPLFPSDGAMCAKSKPWFYKKWNFESDSVTRVVSEEQYKSYEELIGESIPSISNSWKDWSYSKIGIMYNERMITHRGGESRTWPFMTRDYVEFRSVKSIA